MNAPCGPMPFLLAWGGVYAVMVTATFFRPLDPGSYGAQPVSHALAYLSLPLAMLLVTWYWSLSAEPTAVLRAAAPAVVAAMCANTVIEVIQLKAGNALAVGFLPRFWDASQTGVGSVTALAGAGNGRRAGVHF